jgi:hypothetical protein
MRQDTYRPERDVTPDYLATVARWVEATGEVFVVMRYLRAAGAKGYAFIQSVHTFRQLIDLCPTGTDIIVFRDRQLPIRGRVNDDFIRDAQSQIHDGTKYLCVCVRPQSPSDPRLRGDMGDSHASLIEDLQYVQGELVALGPCPQFIDPDSDRMVSASKGGIDGPR